MAENRLSVVIQHLKVQGKIYNDADFSAKVGKGRSYVSEVKSGKRPLTEHFVLLIEEVYPEINGAWLLTGEGEMLKPSPEHVKILEEREKMIAYADDIRDDLQGRVVCYDLELTCGFDRAFLTPESRVGSVDLPNVRISQEAFAVRATGESMLPMVNNGDWVVLRQVHQYEYVDYGKIYAILTDDHNFLKRIRKHPESPKTHYLLISDNEAAGYDPIDLPKADIRQLFVVEHILAFRAV